MGFSRALTQTGFQHRATPVPGGRVAYKLSDGSGHVSLAIDEWEAFGARFRDEVRPVGRMTTYLSIGLFPSIFVFGMTIAQVLPGAGILIVAGIFLGPLAIYLWQSHRIRAIARAIEMDLARLPRIAGPPPVRWRVPRALEIAALVLIGPHLIIQVYGSFFPDAFRNTPWTGMHLDATGMVGFVLLAILIYFRWRQRPAPEPQQEAVAVPIGRQSSIIARARGDAP